MKEKPIYTIDLETDPFKYGRVPESFCIGFYDGKTFTHFWGKNHIQKMREFIEALPPGIIYAHNGGKFDIYYLMDWIVRENQGDTINSGSDAFIINGRIVKAEMLCNSGTHEIRDSYAILPVPLRAYKKDDISYEKLEEDVREIYREEIVKYLEADCIYLHELCSGFVAEFGPKLTIGSTAMGELQKFHAFESMSKDQDEKIRSLYYYGGRVQCFQKGIIKGEYNVYDVNSMYPHAMRDYKHPIGGISWESKTISKHTAFVTAEGVNNGAFPRRDKDGIHFDQQEGIFHVTIHEWKVALRHNLFIPKRIVKCINFGIKSTFTNFVDYFYNARIKAKTDGDDLHNIFYKLVLNSAYGKFAQNPEGYFQYKITDSKVSLLHLGWFPALFPNEKYTVWSQPSPDFARFNVATAASITGASRAILLDAIARSKGIAYCDTDSLVCESISDLDSDPKKLGAWKHEAKCDTLAIAGKKLYAFFENGECVKQASKGVRLSPKEIVSLCMGEIVESKRDAPSFKIGEKLFENMTPGEIQHSFITRNVRMR